MDKKSRGLISGSSDVPPTLGTTLVEFRRQIYLQIKVVAVIAVVTTLLSHIGVFYYNRNVTSIWYPHLRSWDMRLETEDKLTALVPRSGESGWLSR